MFAASNSKILETVPGRLSLILNSTEYSAADMAGNVVFGAYCSTKARSDGKSFGSESSFLFCLLPQCNSFRYMDNSGDHNFAYLDTKSNPGIGFGGCTPETSRIWIDKDIVNGSRVRDGGDSTCERGSIVPHYLRDKPLPLESIEVWVMTDDATRSHMCRVINE